MTTTQPQASVPEKDFWRSPSCQYYLQIIDTAFSGKPKEQIRIADLGCYNGQYAAAFARQGYEVVGIEAKPPNYEMCLQVQERWGRSNLSFVLDDARAYYTAGEAYCYKNTPLCGAPYSRTNGLHRSSRRTT